MTQSPIQKASSGDKAPMTANDYYDGIVRRISELNGNELSEKEAHAAARNLIGFCQKVIEIRSREIK